MSNSILVLAAHPDDEVLGCGGSIAKFSDNGAEVNVAFLADGISSRGVVQSKLNDELMNRRNAAKKACKILGANAIFFGEFPDNSMDSVPLLRIVKAVEDLIHQYKPAIILTHFFGDLNIDHRKVNQAVVTACRPQLSSPVKTLLFYEVPSSTEWQISHSSLTFSPNWFEDISTTLDRKLAAIAAYNLELHKWPHPRSLEGVKSLARWRGAIIGVDAAESFVLGRQIK